MAVLAPTRSDLMALGFATAVAQAVLLREAMAALGGSELAWGAVLSVWLLAMGLGSRAGVGWLSAPVAAWLPAAVMLGATCGTLLLRATPALVGAAPGEAVTTWRALWIWPAAVAPAACAGGLAFPLLAGERDSGGPGSSYALESLGAFAGGLLFSFAMAPLGSAVALVLSTAVVLTSACWQRSRLIAAAVLLCCLAAAWPAGDLLARVTWRLSGRPGELAAWAETRHQRIELSAGEPASLYADGRLVATYPDPYVTVPRAHLLMLLHPDPRRIMATGTTVDGTILTMLRHPVERLHVVEADPALPDLLGTWYPEEMTRGLVDERIHFGASDPRRALDAEPAWDLILLLGGNPTTLRANRTLTAEFLAACQQRLAPDGIVVIRLDVSDTYLGGAAGRLLGIIYSTLRTVFAEAVVIPGESVFLVAGDRSLAAVTDPVRLEQRWRERGLKDSVFVPEMVPLLLDSNRRNELETTLRSIRAPVNTRDRPRAVLLAAGLAEARGQPPLLRLATALEARRPMPLAMVLIAVVVVVLAAAWRTTWTGLAAAAVVGFSSMAWWLLLLAAWQASLGSVYAEVGALSAAFMAGLAGGALLTRRSPVPQRLLPRLFASGIGLSLAILAGLPHYLSVVTVPLLLMSGGLLTGAAFAGVARLAGRDSDRSAAGIGFAADEAGAAVAALLVGLIALPWAGFATTIAGVAVLQLAATVAVVVRAR